MQIRIFSNELIFTCFHFVYSSLKDPPPLTNLAAGIRAKSFRQSCAKELNHKHGEIRAILVQLCWKHQSYIYTNNTFK